MVDAVPMMQPPPPEDEEPATLEDGAPALPCWDQLELALGMDEDMAAMIARRKAAGDRVVYLPNGDVLLTDPLG